MHVNLLQQKEQHCRIYRKTNEAQCEIPTPLGFAGESANVFSSERTPRTETESDCGSADWESRRAWQCPSPSFSSLGSASLSSSVFCCSDFVARSIYIGESWRKEEAGDSCLNRAGSALVKNRGRMWRQITQICNKIVVTSKLKTKKKEEILSLLSKKFDG